MSETMTDGGESERLAPVIPLFGGSAAPSPAEPAERHEATSTEGTDAWAEQAADHAATGEQARARAVTFIEVPDETTADAARVPAAVREQAERTLLKKLRARSLSVAEARRVLAETGATRAVVDELVDDFLRRNYLDDAALAEQLVHAGADRKGQGRQAISRALGQRGIPRDLADAAVSGLPDDDAERALDFARTKARSLDRVDDDAALRRLLGALFRRGYGGSVASSAARCALAERRSDRAGGSTSGVRFR